MSQKKKPRTKTAKPRRTAKRPRKAAKVPESVESGEADSLELPLPEQPPAEQEVVQLYEEFPVESSGPVAAEAVATDRMAPAHEPEEAAQVTWKQKSKLWEFAQNCYVKPGSGNHYFYLDGRQRFNPWSDRDVSRKLRDLGACHRIPDGKLTSEVDEILLWIQENRCVDIARPVAGRQQGYKEENGLRILVLGGPKLPIPQHGDFSELWAFLCQLCGAAWKPGEEDDPYLEHQIQTLCFWILRGYLAISRELPSLFRQILYLIGPRGCGKTFLQTVLFRALFGGRALDIDRHISGEERFNGELFSNEILFASDANSISSDWKARVRQGAIVKGLVTGDTKTCRGLYSEGVGLSPIWVISHSANAEQVNSLPPLSADFEDKCHWILCSPAKFPCESDREGWASRLVSQVPALLAHLLDTFDSPEKLLPELREGNGAGRFGQRAFHHPVLQRMNYEHSKEDLLLHLADQILFKRDDELPGQVPAPWEGSADSLRVDLRNRASSSGLAREVDDLLRGGTRTTGRYLAVLAKRYPLRVQQQQRSAKARGWLIFPPDETHETE